MTTLTPEQRAAHCWTGYTEWVREHYGVKFWWQAPEDVVDRIIGDGDPDTPFNDATCLLLAGHEGPHEFTPDSEIGIEFVAQEAGA